ncbi:hypothetical protein ALO42_101838 [Pseudomonas syringae pv. atrofaciens]|nr:hypothetical protein ALO42_101838 [Pseudomonas syringae pv. atrofaciens]KPY67643.1 hypothetical protein ALO45_101398 [Pseudomonas syringae pv. syringae]RML31613.1 hypothetical protein ALQ96_101433 [Pseudomonas syringae pv. atrofaciens]
MGHTRSPRPTVGLSCCGFCLTPEAAIYLSTTFTYLPRPAPSNKACRVGNGCGHVAHG